VLDVDVNISTTKEKRGRSIVENKSFRFKECEKIRKREREGGVKYNTIARCMAMEYGKK